MAQKRITFDLDLDDLLPGDEFQIGKTSITIRPLGLLQFKTVVGKLRLLVKDAQDQGITQDTMKDPINMLIIAELVMTKFPDILEEVSNVDMSIINQLPIEIIVGLIDKCFEVNFKAKDALLKNWKSLLGRVEPLTAKK